MRRTAVALAIALTSTAVAAHADPEPDPAAARAGDANLESTAHRRGLVFGGALGLSLTFGGGTPAGGGLLLRIGQVATPKTVITFTVGGDTQLHKVGDEVIANSVGYGLAGGQYWVGPSLWVSLGLGVGNYHCNQCQNDAKQTVDTRRAGLASGAGIGVDLVRFHGVVLGLELHGMTLLARGGMITTGGMSLGLSFD
ncbi:MAG: hypothetical protein IPQ07_32845 [Myxococcales bacterium]|nr:hypothetical protein [Myxococcales bacterium]